MSASEKMLAVRANQLFGVYESAQCVLVMPRRNGSPLDTALLIPIINIRLCEIHLHCLERVLRALRQACLFVSNTDTFRSPGGFCGLGFIGELLRSRDLSIGGVRGYLAHYSSESVSRVRFSRIGLQR